MSSKRWAYAQGFTVTFITTGKRGDNGKRGNNGKRDENVRVAKLFL